MKKEIKLTDKIKKYSAFASGIIVHSMANSQINYTDINPDRIMTGQGDLFSIDFDGDSNNDFNLITINQTSTSTFVSGPYVGLTYKIYWQGVLFNCPGNNEAIVNGNTNLYPLNYNDAINLAQNFYNIYGSTSGIFLGVDNRINNVATSVSYSNLFYTGNWHGQGDKFAGVKFKIGSNTHYGWARMEVTQDCDSVIIKDYAYNTVPGQGILAGQTALGVNETDWNDVSAYAYGKTIFVNRTSEMTEQLTIYSVDGKSIFTKTINSRNESIELNNVPSGIYILQIGNRKKKISL